MQTGRAVPGCLWPCCLAALWRPPWCGRCPRARWPSFARPKPPPGRQDGICLRVCPPTAAHAPPSAKMAALMATTRGVFAARTMAPVVCMVTVRSPLASRSTAFARPSQTSSSFLGGEQPAERREGGRVALASFLGGAEKSSFEGGTMQPRWPNWAGKDHAQRGARASCGCMGVPRMACDVHCCCRAAPRCWLQALPSSAPPWPAAPPVAPWSSRPTPRRAWPPPWPTRPTGALAPWSAQRQAPAAHQRRRWLAAWLPARCHSLSAGAWRACQSEAAATAAGLVRTGLGLWLVPTALKASAVHVDREPRSSWQVVSAGGGAWGLYGRRPNLYSGADVLRVSVRVSVMCSPGVPCGNPWTARRKRRRVSGFRARKATKNGLKVLKARRQRGRWNLCPASNKKSGGKK